MARILQGPRIIPGVLKVNAAFELVSHSTTDFSYGVAVASGGAHVFQGLCFNDRTRETQPSGHLLDTLSIFFQPLTYLHGLLNFSRILTQDISLPGIGGISRCQGVLCD